MLVAAVVVVAVVTYEKQFYALVVDQCEHGDESTSHFDLTHVEAYLLTQGPLPLDRQTRIAHNQVQQL